jgi:tetratricopeptide (TPR) repeat protein
MKKLLLAAAIVLMLCVFTGIDLAAWIQSVGTQEIQTKPDVNELIKRAESMVARKLYDDAIEVYKQCVALSPRDASIYNRLGVAYHRKQALHDAGENYRRAIKINPLYAEAYNNLGTIAFMENKFSKAIKYYKKALKLKPDSATMHYNLGSAYFAKDQYEKAFAEYQIAFKADPDLMEHISATGSLVRTAALSRAKYHFYLAKIYAEMGSIDRAIDYLTRAFEEGFKDKESLNTDKSFSSLVKDERFIRLMQTPPKPIE